MVSATELLELVFVIFCHSNVKTMRYITDGVDGRVRIVKYVKVTRSRDVFAITCFLRQKFCPHFFCCLPLYKSTGDPTPEKTLQ